MDPNQPQPNNDPNQVPSPTPAPALQPFGAPQPSSPTPFQSPQPAAAPLPTPAPPAEPAPGSFGATPQSPFAPPSPTPIVSPDQPSWQQSAAPTTPASKGKLFLIIGIVVAVLALGAGAYFFLLQDTKGGNPISGIASNITGTKDVVDRTDGTLDLSKLIDRQETIKAQDLKAKLNQQVNLSDGTSYMVTKIERKAAIDNVKASSGKEFLLVSLVVGNRTEASTIYTSSLMFKLKNAAGGKQSSYYIGAEKLPDLLESQDLAAGKQAKGVLAFEVDQGEAASITTEDNYENFQTKEKIKITSEVALQ